ncbi:unnamed protein product [Gongylonema pulchrum]|uniref:2-oxoacid_dh domain-containing protein n=1 Tax=Gongylonema pulchrum TaxID=637853 RepID=A0A183D796_9BILA|nr:unnamed protein product [Gongylonema pulchrum]
MIVVDRLMLLREELKKDEAAHGARMTFMPMIIKAVSLALTRFPRLNAVADENFQNIIYKASHNISIAMDTPDGLVVPNIKHCEQRTIWEIAAELNRLQEASGRAQVAPEDLKDGTFTLSNVGMVSRRVLYCQNSYYLHCMRARITREVVRVVANASSNYTLIKLSMTPSFEHYKVYFAFVVALQS